MSRRGSSERAGPCKQVSLDSGASGCLRLSRELRVKQNVLYSCTVTHVVVYGDLENCCRLGECF